MKRGGGVKLLVTVKRTVSGATARRWSRSSISHHDLSYLYRERIPIRDGHVLLPAYVSTAQ